MPINVRQIATGTQNPAANPITATFGVPTLAGSLLVAVHQRRNLTGVCSSSPPWVPRGPQPVTTVGGGGSGGRMWAFTKPAAGETVVSFTNTGANVNQTSVYEIDSGIVGGTVSFIDEIDFATAAAVSPHQAGPLTPYAHQETCLFLFGIVTNDKVLTALGGAVEDWNTLVPGATPPRLWGGHQIILDPTGATTLQYSCVTANAYAALGLVVGVDAPSGGAFVPGARAWIFGG